MSWPQRAGGAAPARPQRPGQPLQQGFNNQQNMYPNYPGVPPAAGNTQQQYWQAQQPQYNQQYGQAYQQQDYGNNANQFYQQTPQYNQNYANQGYTDTQQQYPQGYYQNQTAQQPGYPPQPKADNWEENWDWGWDEASKQAQQAAGHNQTSALPSQPTQQQVYNNANVIEESFASTDTWNWSMEDKKDANGTVPTSKQEHAVLPNDKTENKPASEPPRSISNASNHTQAEEVRTLSDREAVKERLPNLALGKRLQLENLTPQWSIESQMSQESSDGPQTHSEGTYRSDNQSRNSSKSSPGVNTENSNFNFPPSSLEEYTPSNEWSRHSNEDTLVDNNQVSHRRQSHDELTNSLQEMIITNRENPAPEHALTNNDSTHAPPSVSPANFPPPMSSFMPPPTMPLPNMPPAPPVTGAALPPTSASAVLAPPTNFPQTSTNPFKQTGPSSYKKVATIANSLQSFPPTSTSSILSSPNVVNKVSQHRVPVGFGANLETTPDNSERPDQPHMSGFRPAPAPQQVPENMEVAPQNDRNEYLQTAHLSSSDYGENTDFSRNAPPPGLRRMVVGQQESESEYNQNLNISGDEPPPGLARMVPGQQTEGDNSYNQPDNYMERHVDGQQTDGSGRPYRQADGQQTPANYSQPPNRGSDRRPIGLDRMVPGEPSNNEYPQYQTGNYSANEQRVVTGVDHDYPVPSDAGPTDIREQNVDGSDYSEQAPRPPITVQRNIIGARDVNDTAQDYNLPEDQQREVTMEGENLQDLSIIPAPDASYLREQTFDGADMNTTVAGADRKTDLSDSIEHPSTSSRRQSLNHGNTSGDESDRDRAFKSSPRRDRDKHKSSRDRDRDRERDKEGRYSRGDRKYDREREERRAGRESEKPDRERDWARREESPHSRRHRRSTRSRRYETEDTDYYSDRERDRRSTKQLAERLRGKKAYREGSYASKPPRPEDSRRPDRSRRYNTIERDRRPDERDRRPDERDRRRDRPRSDRDRHDARYRDIDPTRKHGNLRAERDDEDRRRGELYSSSSRPDSREAAAVTDEDLNDTVATEPRRRDRRSRHARPDPYYDMAGYAAGGYPDAYAVQRQQYEYYERLRASDPRAYLQLYKQIMAGRAPPLLGDKHSYTTMYAGYEPRAEDRGSGHSGRSSANGLKGNDTYYSGLGALRMDTSSLRGAPSVRTDLSDRDLNTDASLNLHLEDSTVRSERMTPFKFSTAHIKGDIGSRNIVVVRPSYPVDGLPATVHIVSLAAALARDPAALELQAYPGPLVKGVTHKLSVIEYCQSRVKAAGRAAPRDTLGYVLVWELLALLLRQNGVVVGTDIAELLMKNTREYEYKITSSKNSTHNDSRRGSSLSAREEERAWSPDHSAADLTPVEEPSSPSRSPADEKAALDKLREYLIYGNRQDALEWAMSCGLWGHALQLAGSLDRRARAAVSARFLAAIPRRDPLHSLYAHLQARQPPAATCVAEERWGDWRAHAAIMLANGSSKPDHDRRTLTQLGDSLLSRGLLYSAQFCYVSAGEPFSRHPLAPLQPAAPAAAAPAAPPRLALLAGDARAGSLAQFATNQAIFATEIYEYALSLNQDYVINELQVYKLVLATRLADAGQYERALGYAEAAARAAGRAPRLLGPRLLRALARLADRLRHADPGLHVADDEDESPRHASWVDDVASVANMLASEAASEQSTPQHHYYEPPPQPAPPAQPPPPAPPVYDQTQHQEYQPPPPQSYPEPEGEPDYSQYYQQAAPPVAPTGPPVAPTGPPVAHADPPAQAGWREGGAYDGYWQDAPYAYGEPAGVAGGGGAGGEEPRPMITMPGATKQRNVYGDYDGDRSPSPDNEDHDSSQTTGKPQPKKTDKGKDDGKQGSGWLGGILTKLSLRAPNQMILPDDKNPSIVWDAETKRWRNLDGEEEPAGAPPPPPPPPAAPPHLQNSSSGTQPPPHSAAPVSNIFKMQKGRHIKKSYVDVFNPPGAAARAAPADAPPPPPPAPAPLAAPAYFIPQPVHNNQAAYYEPSLQDTDEDQTRLHSAI